MSFFNSFYLYFSLFYLGWGINILGSCVKSKFPPLLFYRLTSICHWRIQRNMCFYGCCRDICVFNSGQAFWHVKGFFFSFLFLLFLSFARAKIWELIYIWDCWKKLSLFQAGAVGLVFQALLLSMAVAVYLSGSISHQSPLLIFLSLIVSH